MMTTTMTKELNGASDSIIYGLPPLWDGEDVARYNAFRAEVLADIEPGDVMERVLINDYVDLAWEVLRLRLLQANLIRGNVSKGLGEVLTPLKGPLQAKTLSEGWLARKPEALEEVNKILAAAGLSMDTVMAQTFSVALDPIERINRMIQAAEARRNKCLHEIYRHRETLAQTLRRSVQQIENGQLRVIESPSIDGAKPQ
jgi:hypothetical protein